MSEAQLKEILNMKFEDFPDPVRIRGSGKRGRQKKQIRPDLYREFAKIDNGLALLEFIKKYGRLTNEEGGDAVEELLDQAKEMRRDIAWADKHKRHPGGAVFELGAMVSLNYRTRRITRTVFPRTLLQALWLQFIYTPIGEGKLLKCKYCDEEFWAGAGTHRRADAKFCSHKHQVLFNSLKRSNPQLEKRT
jgi:hypothetical protein